MSFPPVLIFSAPVGTATQDLLGVYQRLLGPLIEELLNQPELPVAVGLSGSMMESLPQELPPQLAELSKRKSFEVVAGAFYDPLLLHSSSQELSLQFDLTITRWKALGVSTVKSLYLRKDWSDHLLAYASSREIQHILIPSSTFRTPKGDTFRDKESNISILPYIEHTLGALRQTSADTSAISGGLQILRLDAMEFSEHDAAGLPAKVLNWIQQANVSATKDLAPSPTDFNAGAQLSLDDLRKLLPPQSAAAKSIFYRLTQFTGDLEKAHHLLESRPHRETNQERLKQARAFLLRAQTGDIYRHPLLPYSLRRAVSESLLRAQVEVDTATHPEVDPLHGWVDFQWLDFDIDGRDELIIDTQLLRLYVRPSLAGSIIEFDYKPRKVDLVSTQEPDLTRGLSFVEALLPYAPENPPELCGMKLAHDFVHSQLSPVEILVTKRSLDLLGLRFSRTLSCKLSSGAEYTCQLIKHLTVKAGIGAHLNNATTGLTLEMWIEADSKPPPGLSLVTQWAFMLPSGNPSALSLRPLTSAGAALDRVVPFDSDKKIAASDAPAGLHGGRLIDGVGSFVMDIRTSKPLQAVFLDHMRAANGAYEGTYVHFLVEASRIFEDHRSQTIFLSIQ